MAATVAFDQIRTAIQVTLMVSTPLLATALVVGVLVSLVQAVTQIQEQTLTFVPKVAAIAVVLFAMLPWFLQQLVQYLVDAFTSIPGLLS